MSIQHSLRAGALVILALAASLPPVPAQLDLHRVLSSPQGGAVSSYAGTGFAALGDVDGDGHDDFAMGSAFETFGIGRVRLYSGATGSLIWNVLGPVTGRSFGFSLARLGDVDGDDIDDLVVGAPETDLPATNAGAAYVLSGANGSILRSFDWSFSGDKFGSSVAGLRIPGVFSPMVVVGIPYRGTDRGGFVIYDASTGALYFTYLGDGIGDLAGWSVANAGDFTGDGKEDVVIGCPGATNSDGGNGEARVISVAPGTTTNAAIISGGPGNSAFGFAVSGNGDADGDGFADVIVGAPEYDAAGADNGRVQVRSGPFGNLYASATGSNGAFAGMSVAFVGDVDGDGCDDFAYGAPGSTAPGAPTGRITLRSGRTNGGIGFIQDTLGLPGFGSVVSAAGDPNRDGHPDILLANPEEDLAWLVGVTSLLPGSREDLVLRTSVDGGAYRTWPESLQLGANFAGISLGIQLLSPKGSYEGTLPFIAGWLRPSGAPPAVVPGFPEVHVDPASLVFLFDATQLGIFGPAILTESGITLTGQLPPGLTGLSLLLQGAVLAPSPYFGNPALTVTNAVEWRFVAGGVSTL